MRDWKKWERSHRRKGLRFEPVLVDGFANGAVALWLPLLPTFLETLGGILDHTDYRWLSRRIRLHPDHRALQGVAGHVIVTLCGGLTCGAFRRALGPDLKTLAETFIRRTYEVDDADLAELLAGDEWHAPLLYVAFGGDRVNEQQPPDDVAAFAKRVLRAAAEEARAAHAR